MLSMPSQRKSSREYMTAILGRPARLRDCVGQFECFIYYLADRVKTAFKEPIHFDWAEGHGAPFMELVQHDGPILLGTFHVGYSDLMGFFTSVFQKRIHMLRLRMDNSEDTDRLEAFAGEFLKIIWVNKVQETIYALKDVISNGGSVAMQCDRVQYASKLDGFNFLGERRSFPFTIYSLSMVFKVPVVFVIAGMREESNHSIPVYTSTVYRPDQSSKAENLKAAREHFQSVLDLLETLLRANPGMWFNFEPLNPVEKL